MLPVDRIRFQIIRARREEIPSRRDEALSVQLVDAMIEERRNTGGATETALTERYGFTLDEIRRLGRAAVDEATQRFVDRAMVDPVAA